MQDAEATCSNTEREKATESSCCLFILFLTECERGIQCKNLTLPALFSSLQPCAMACCAEVHKYSARTHLWPAVTAELLTNSHFPFTAAVIHSAVQNHTGR